jgi:hypothetical protein
MQENETVDPLDKLATSQVINVLLDSYQTSPYAMQAAAKVHEINKIVSIICTCMHACMWVYRNFCVNLYLEIPICRRLMIIWACFPYGDAFRKAMCWSPVEARQASGCKCIHWHLGRQRTCLEMWVTIGWGLWYTSSWAFAWARSTTTSARVITPSWYRAFPASPSPCSFAL